MEPTPIHRKRYTKKQKTTVVIAAEMSSVAAAAEATGIPATNIRRWRDDPALAEYGAKTREEVADGFKMLTGLAIDRLAVLVPTMEPRDLIILAGVGVDKGQLLAGGATSRAETIDLTGAFDDHEREALAAILHDAIGESDAGD